VLLDARVLQPLAQAAHSDASRLAHGRIRVDQALHDHWPHLTHLRRQVFADALDRDAEGKKGRAPVRRVCRSKVLVHERAQGWENLVRREQCCEIVNYAQRRLDALSEMARMHMTVQTSLTRAGASSSTSSGCSSVATGIKPSRIDAPRFRLCTFDFLLEQPEPISSRRNEMQGTYY
jgi:hypothetical protein